MVHEVVRERAVKALTTDPASSTSSSANKKTSTSVAATDLLLKRGQSLLHTLHMPHLFCLLYVCVCVCVGVGGWVGVCVWALFLC